MIVQVFVVDVDFAVCCIPLKEQYGGICPVDARRGSNSVTKGGTQSGICCHGGVIKFIEGPLEGEAVAVGPSVDISVIGFEVLIKC